MQKKIMFISLLGVLLLGGLLNAGSVSEDILKDQAKINRKQQELNAELQEARVRYRDKPSKLAEKERKYQAEQEELDYDKKELQFKKDNIELLTKIENKRYQIHLEKRKSRPNWDIIEKLIDERNVLEEEYNRKKLNQKL